jgi:signal transduction histidine kinase
MLRVICGELRPPALAPFGLEKAIRSHADHFSEIQPNIAIHLDLDADQQTLPEQIRLALFRIYQALVTNIVRHANATEAWVELKLSHTNTLLVVRDNGIGFDPTVRRIDLARKGHLGLVGVAERAESLGGTLTVESAPGQGTTIRVSIPHGKETKNKE